MGGVLWINEELWVSGGEPSSQAFEDFFDDPVGVDALLGHAADSALLVYSSVQGDHSSLESS